MGVLFAIKKKLWECLMIEEILKKISLDKSELELYKTALSQHETESLLSDEEYEEVNNELKSYLQFSNIENFNFSFAPCATDIINALFDKYVDDDTLIITTCKEHKSTTKCLKQHKNVQIVYDKNKSQELKFEGNYKRIFIFMIGTSCAEGEFTYDYVFDNIISAAKATEKEVITVIDACQELFLLPRNYSRFDYIIGTGHALVPKFNVGILLRKDSCLDVGKRLAVSKTFCVLLKLLMKRKDIIHQFNMAMNIEFGILKNSHFKTVSHINHLFFIKSNNGEFNDTGVEVDNSYYGMLFRACFGIFCQDEFLKDLKRVKMIIDSQF